MSKVALITGITGQDGAYLAEYLVKKDIRCMVSNVVHPCSTQTVSIIFIMGISCGEPEPDPSLWRPDRQPEPYPYHR